MKKSLAVLLVLMSLGVRSAHALDQNGDGMSDVWQRVHNIANGDTSSDPDGDGQNNGKEAEAGTDPRDSNDYFRTFDFLVSPAFDSVTLSWRSVEQRFYEIEESTDLITWEVAGDITGGSGLSTTATLSVGNPINDLFANRWPASTSSIETTGFNVGASYEAAEPINPSVAGGKTVWWSWSSSTSGSVTITTVGSDFDTTLAIYSGSDFSNLVLLGANDDSGGLQSSVTFTAQAGVPYSIQVDGYSGATGSIVLNHPISSGILPPPNAPSSGPPKMFFRVRGVPNSDNDSDGDSLLTWEERLLGTDPYDYDRDSDNDGMDDGFEFIYQFDPLSFADGELDADGDQLTNAMESLLGLNPRVTDSDNNGTSDANEDRDLDGLTNIQEILTHGTDPAQPDTDLDGLSDGWEITYGFSALINNDTDGNPSNDASADPDGDGLDNGEEDQIGSSPASADTDGDGFSDFDENQAGSQVGNPASTPANPGGTPGGPSSPPPPTVPVQVNFGDHSGSHSEKYRVYLDPLEGDANTQRRYRTNRNYGVTQTETFHLPAGAKYKVTLVHIATDPQYEGPPEPDYDYTLEFTTGGSDPAIKSIPDDPQKMLGVHDESEQFFASGKDATLYIAWLTSETVATLPADRTRKKLGVGEEVNLTLKPASLPSPSWALTGTTGSTILTPSSNTANLEAGMRTCTPTVQATVLGASVQIAYNIVQPSGERARKIRDFTVADGYFSATQQGVGMFLEVTVLPDDVSFYNVEVIEIDKGTQNITGFFNNFPASALQHHPNPDWIQLTEDNLWNDTAGFFGWGSPSTWTNGTYEWAIEVRWRVTGKETEQGEIVGNRTQTHTLNDNTGKSTEAKLGNTAIRTP